MKTYFKFFYLISFFVFFFLSFDFISFASGNGVYTLDFDTVTITPVFSNNTYNINSGSGTISDNVSLLPLFYRTDNTYRNGTDYQSFTSMKWVYIDKLNTSPLQSSILRLYPDGTYTDIYGYILIPIGVYDTNTSSPFTFSFSSGSSNFVIFMVTINSCKSSAPSGFYDFFAKLILSDNASIKSSYPINGSIISGPGTSVLMDGDFTCNTYVYTFNGKCYLPSSRNFFQFYVFVDLPDSSSVTIPSGTFSPGNYSNAKSFYLYNGDYLLDSSLGTIDNSINKILDSLVSSGGANSELNDKNDALSSSMSDYQKDTDTSAQYSKIDDSLFQLDTSIFTSFASTISLFSACVSGIFTAMGDFAVPLTLFLTIVFITVVVGLFQIQRSSGSDSDNLHRSREYRISSKSSRRRKK